MGVIIIIAVLIGLIVGPGLWVRRVMDRYSEPADRYSGTGAELARHLLDLHQLENVRVEATDKGDHYDPGDKTVRLSAGNHDGRSLTAITIAAHEVGHALQDAEDYGPLRARTMLVRTLGPLERLGAGILMLSPFSVLVTRVPQVGLLMFIGGLLTLATSIIVHFVTLPTEFNASFARALPLLHRHRILHPADGPHARRLLTAAAMTYVSASLMSLLNIARWWALLRR